jgi:DNA-binding transcriptional ArsR family regulator
MLIYNREGVSMSRRRAAVDVFQAVSSPVRRALLDKLSNREQTVRNLAAPFQMTLPAISQQLQILREAGLVTARRAGRWRVYRLNAEPLRQVSRWLEGYDRFWTARLKALGEDLKRYEKLEERWR